MSVGSAVQGLPLQVESLSPTIAKTVDTSATLARELGITGGEKVSLKLFRARLLTATASDVGKINLDTGSFPQGVANKYDQMLLGPIAWAVPLQFTELARQMEGDKVATNSILTDTLTRIAEQTQNFRDIFLQTPGDGSIGSVDSVAGTLVTLRSSTSTVIDGRGAHLCKEQQTVQFMSTAYVLRGSARIQTVFKGLGQTQQIQIDVNPGGIVAGDLVIVNGCEPGGPQFINGLPFFISTSTSNTLYGIPRALPYVVANGLNLSNAAQVTKPIFRVLQNQIIQRLGPEALMGQFYHTHPSQLQAFEELAWTDTVTMNDGKAGSYDPLYADFKINGRKILVNPRADQTRWDLLNKPSWKSIKWGPGQWWYTLPGGQKTFPVMDPATGLPTVQQVMYWIVSEQYYVDNPIVQGAITGCKIPANN